MTVSRIVAGIALAALATPSLAQVGASAGRIAETNGSVFVARDGKLLPATAGTVLLKGDRVVTRADSSAKVAMAKCSVSLQSTSMVSVGDSCATTTLAASRAGFNGANAADEDTVVLGLLAAGAAGAGLYFALKGSNKAKSP